MDPFFERDGIRAIVVGPALVVHYHGEIDASAVRELVERRRIAHETHATLSIVSASTPIPPANVVAEIFEISRSSERSIVAEAAVILAGGALGLAGRSIVNILFSRVRPTPARIFGRVHDAAEFIAMSVGDASLAPILELAVVELEDDVATSLRSPPPPPRESFVRFLDPEGDRQEAARPWPVPLRDASSRKAR